MSTTLSTATNTNADTGTGTGTKAATGSTTPELRRLPDGMLEGFRARAGDLDRANAYFTEDLAELRSAGYLAA
ncbi:MAG TPA: hypothetical protein VFZ68_11890, partial [Acidimicrobiales bacterium]